MDILPHTNAYNPRPSLPVFARPEKDPKWFALYTMPQTEQSVIRLLGSIASSAPYLTKKFIEPRLIFKENVPVQ